MRSCSINGCQNKHHAGGYCRPHYDKIKKALKKGENLVNVLAQLSLDNNDKPSVSKIDNRLNYLPEKNKGKRECPLWKGVVIKY